MAAIVADFFHPAAHRIVRSTTGFRILKIATASGVIDGFERRVPATHSDVQKTC